MRSQKENDQEKKSFYFYTFINTHLRMRREESKFTHPNKDIGSRDFLGGFGLNIKRGPRAQYYNRCALPRLTAKLGETSMDKLEKQKKEEKEKEKELIK